MFRKMLFLVLNVRTNMCLSLIDKLPMLPSDSTSFTPVISMIVLQTSVKRLLITVHNNSSQVISLHNT